MTIYDRIDKIKLSVLIIFILISIIIVCCGCIGGKSVNAHGAGTTISPSRLIQQPNGIFRLEPVEIQHPKSKPVKIEPVRSRPTPPELKSAEAVEIEPKMNVIPARELPKDPPKIIIPELPTITSQTGELPIIIDNGGNEYRLTPAEKDKMKVNWMELIHFYLWAALFLALMYFGWKVARKKTEAMISEERGKKKAPKKRAAKKAPKKRATKRK